MIHGDKKKIKLTISDFKRFIESGCLYIDKTKFIEDIVNEVNEVLLFTRPRRTGKSMNLDMLRVFFDCNKDTGHLFRGLYIEESEAFSQINKYPVVFLDFKRLDASSYQDRFKELLSECAEYYLEESEMNRWLKKYLYTDNDYSTSALLNLCGCLYQKYKVRPYVLIDEYDKILMDNLEGYAEIKKWLVKIFESNLKGNNFIEKVIMTGVARISKESLLSGFNNLLVYDIFTPSVYDTAFSLTQTEVKELLNESELNAVHEWYNNIRVGSEKLYNIYSVLSYLSLGKLENYWGNSGTMHLLFKMMNKNMMDQLAQLVTSNDNFILTRLEKRLSLERLLKSSSGIYYYSLAVQAGYLTYDIEEDAKDGTVYKICIPNLELQRVWRDYIMDNIVDDSGDKLRQAFKNISDTEAFNQSLQEFVSYQLSYFDFDNELEKTYHVFVFGMLLALGYKCNSNIESGFGRYDILVEADDFNAIIEFKKASSEAELEAKADEALRQIEARKYHTHLNNNLPVYKIGVSCFKKQCLVKTLR